MLHNQKITVVIPTMNEEKGIRQTLEITPKFVDEVIIVDGDSKDRSREIAEEFGKSSSFKVKVILEKRRGYGRAFKTGFEHATGDIIATGDGDATYPIELIDKVIDYLLKNDLEFVSCSRLPLEDAASMKSRNWVGNYLMTIAASTLWAHVFKDVLSGMWVFRKRCLAQLKLLSDSWNFSEEIKIQAYTKLGAKFQEYKIPYRERLGETKLVPWKVGLQNIGYMLAMRTGTVSILQKTFKKNQS